MGREIVSPSLHLTYLTLTHLQSTEKPQRCHSSRPYHYRPATNPTIFQCKALLSSTRSTTRLICLSCHTCSSMALQALERHPPFSPSQKNFMVLNSSNPASSNSTLPTSAESPSFEKKSRISQECNFHNRPPLTATNIPVRHTK